MEPIQEYRQTKQFFADSMVNETLSLDSRVQAANGYASLCVVDMLWEIRNQLDQVLIEMRVGNKTKPFKGVKG